MPKTTGTIVDSAEFSDREANVSDEAIKVDYFVQGKYDDAEEERLADEDVAAYSFALT